MFLILQLFQGWILIHLWSFTAANSKSMKKEDKGDMDNDGKDEPDDEEYLQNKDKAIKKAMKKESKSLKDVGGVVGIPALGDFVRGK